jgi:hypothetical protein
MSATAWGSMPYRRGAEQDDRLREGRACLAGTAFADNGLDSGPGLALAAGSATCCASGEAGTGAA